MSKSMRLKTNSLSLVNRKRTDCCYESTLNDARKIMEEARSNAIVPDSEHIAFAIELFVEIEHFGCKRRQKMCTFAALKKK